MEYNWLLEILSKKVLENDLTESEEKELEQWLQDPQNKEIFDNELDRQRVLQSVEHSYSIDESSLDEKLELLLSRKRRSVTVKKLVRYMAAAIIIGVLAISGLLYHQKSRTNGLADKPRLKADLAPGGNKAVLTLSDGSSIILDSAKNGTLTLQGNSKVLKLSNGQLAYAVQGNATTPITFNTIMVPIGGQYQVTLPDHSKVWLNANSTLRFPTSFSGQDRTVELTGEAYLEVAHDKAKPFRVKVGDMNVTVLGTSFDINAYSDEKAIRATLLDGVIRVSRGNQTALLRPGQQAQVGSKQFHVIEDANTEEAVAWKNGMFEFNGADIETVMRSIARWYHVQVSYAGEKNIRHLTIMVRRDNYLSDVLQALEISGYHFKIEGSKIIVLP